MTLHEWVEANYAKLQKYALHQCQGDQDQAHDLLQTVIEAVLAGRYTVDVAQAPLTRFQQMMFHKKWRILHGSDKIRQSERYVNGKGEEKVAVTWHARLCLTGDEWLVAQPMSEEAPSLGDQVARFIESLPPRYQEIMRLRLQGLTYQEIATRLHLHPASVSATARKGVQRLKVLIHDAGDGLDDRGRAGDGQ